ncbi:MAG TPA: LysR family transcriptional regulator [Solirubrobacteraceae bacterium]
MPASETLGSTSASSDRDSPRDTAPVRAPDLAELETLVACAAEGSLVAAAARLGISRPAVAKRVANLEALAGRPLLHRGGRGVRLTGTGARVLAAARRLLAERDVLLRLLTEIRGEERSPIAGLRELLGHSPTISRAAQRPEARLAETERMLELILRSSDTAVVISDPDTSAIHEVNDAFCRFTGRSREELLRSSAIESWHQDREDVRAVDDRARRPGEKRVLVSVQRPDGSLRVGETRAHEVLLAGSRQLLSTVEDITEHRRLEAEREAVTAAYGVLGQLAADMLAGASVIESVGAVLPELRSSGDFASALLWSADAGSPLALDGEEPPAEFDAELRRARRGLDGGVVRLGALDRADVRIRGWAVSLGGEELWVALLGSDSPANHPQSVFADVLGGLAMVVAAAGREA